MKDGFLIDAAVFLAAAAVAAPVAKILRVGSVLGYLAAGILIGPFGMQFVYGLTATADILHIGELGVVLLLFLIGLELKPKRLYAMRRAVFGAGSAQVVPSALMICAAGIILGQALNVAVLIGLALALSSTAFVLQVLDEKQELQTRHGRLAFSILLFQDLAAIPIIALVPALGGTAGEGVSVSNGLFALVVVAAVVVIGRYALDKAFHLVALSGVREAMTATALLTVVGVALLMDAAGLSAALGAFIAGALLAESQYRHQIHADIEPFEGLLLGLFFTAIGVSLDLRTLFLMPGTVFGLVIGLILLKCAVFYSVGRWQGLTNRESRRLALAMCQGGEFAFVIMTTALQNGVVDRPFVGLVNVVVTLSMVATPILLLIDEQFGKPRTQASTDSFDDMPENDGHVVLAGFGRFAQIIARVLKAKGVPFTALDSSPEQVSLVRRFGSEAYFGDSSRLDILHAAQTEKATAFVLALDDVEQSLRTAEVMRTHFPHVPVYARAYDRRHAHRLMDLGVKLIERDTFHSAIEMTYSVLRGLGYSDREARRTVTTFADHDRERLVEEHQFYQDTARLEETARQTAEDLERLFREDAEVGAELATQDDR